MKIEESSILKRALTAAALVLLPLFYFYPAVTGEVALVQGDGWTQNLGVRVLIGQMIAQGMVPLWNPYIFAGTPLLASIYPGALYPPNWLFAIFSPGVAMNVVVITTYHLALAGTYLYARRIGIGRAGALFTGLAFTFGGYLLAHLGHTSRIAAAAWLPWILLAIEHLYWCASWRWVALGSVFIALQLLAGEPQMTLYTVLVSGAYWLFSLTLRRPPSGGWLFAAATLAMATGGTLLSLLQLLPEWELLKQSERAQISYEYFAAYSLPPRQVLTLIFPYFFGGAAMEPYKVPYWGQWGVDEMCSYVGLLTLGLGLVALFGPKRQQLVWFWAGSAVVSLVLAFGAYLPFQLNYLLYHLPIYNLFRASARHLFEFTFSAAVLAGLGVNYVAQREGEQVRRAVRRATVTLAIMVALTTIIYRFFGNYLVTEKPRPAASGSLTIPDLLFPLTFFALSVIALWYYAQRRTILAQAWLLIVLIADLAAFGQFFAWRVITFSVNERVADPSTVSYLKARERDLNAFRIVSHSLLPFAYNYELLNHPNLSIARGLQSVNGYDALRLLRTAAIAGEMTLDGLVQDPTVWGGQHQGFNLLNVKYLLRERPRPIEPWRGLEYEGVRFNELPLNLELGPGSHLELMPGPVVATELAVVSAMAHAASLPDGTPVVKLRLHTRDGQVIERELQVGRDTAEWAYDRADVRANIQHQRPRVAESWVADGFQAHRYLGRLAFARAEIDRIEWDYLCPEARLTIVRATLYDATKGTSTPLDIISLPPERWRKLESFGEVELYENLKLMPRAWFVSHLAVMPSAEVLRVIKTGRMRDGAPFDPAQTALLELEDFGERAIRLPPVGEAAGEEVKITSYEPHRIELETRHPQPGFLVLSEVYYRGWEARLDGQKTTIYRTNYALRGIAVPPGEHRIEFIFRAPTFLTGALYAALGAALLVVGAFVSLKRAGCQ